MLPGAEARREPRVRPDLRARPAPRRSVSAAVKCGREHHHEVDSQIHGRWSRSGTASIAAGTLRPAATMFTPFSGHVALGATTGFLTFAQRTVGFAGGPQEEQALTLFLLWR